MIVKSFELKKVSLDNKIFLIYGENDGLKKEIRTEISKQFQGKEVNYDENEIIKNFDEFANLIKNHSLFDDKKISMDIPVKLNGNPIGVKLGGNLQRNKRKLRIKALPTNLPDNLEIDISELNIGDKVYITELFNENYEFLHPDNTVVCQVRRARAALVVETEEGEGEEGEEGTEEGSEGTPKDSESAEGKESSEVKEDKPADA